MLIPDQLPQLAKGSHSAGSGQACIMNAISYINGDTVITDMPSCADPLLARFAQRLNDSICEHRTGPLLCQKCTHMMWMYGARIIGTSELTKGWDSAERAQLAAQLVMFAADQVAHLKSADDAVADYYDYYAYAVAYADAAVAYADAYYAAYYADASKARYDLHMSLIDEFYRLTEPEDVRPVKTEFTEEEIEKVKIGAKI